MTLANISDARDPVTGQHVVGHQRDAEWFEAIPGERLSLRVRSADVGGRYAIMESHAAPGTAAPLHTHREDEIFYVLGGYPTFRLDDEIVETAPGSLVVIPGGTPHAWKNRTDEEVHMLAIFSPGGVEEFFTKIAGLTPDRIAVLAADYGTFVLGPPIAD